MFKTFPIIFGAISVLSASPLKEELLKPRFNGFNFPSQEEIDRIDAEERIDSELTFNGIPVKIRVNRNPENYAAEERSEEVEEPMPHFNVSSEETDERYVNPNNWGRFTWQTYIRFYLSSSLTSYYTCTGIAICPRIVLSAGHCVEGRSVSLTRVYSSPSTICPPDRTPKLASKFAYIYTLPSYSLSSPNAHDIAFIQLTSNIGSTGSYYNVLPNVPAPPYSSTGLVGLGYGKTGTGTGPLVSACKSWYSAFGDSGCNDFTNSGQWICVKAISTNGGLCGGDSGGPLKINPGIPVGVASFFYGPNENCFDQLGSVYASINHYSASGLIQNIVNSFGGCN